MKRNLVIETYSVQFDFAGSSAIRLRDPQSDQLLTANNEPEWISGTRNVLAAYVGGSQPQVQVVFFMDTTNDGTFLIGARGNVVDIAEQKVTLKFSSSSRSGMSQPVTFTLSAPLPQGAGVHELTFHWYARTAP